MNDQLGNLVEQEKFSAKKTIGFAAYSAASTANGLLVSYLTYYATDSLLLTAAGYDGSLAVQPDSALSAINFMYNIFPAICAAIMFIGCNLLKVEEANKKLRNEA